MSMSARSVAPSLLAVAAAAWGIATAVPAVAAPDSSFDTDPAGTDSTALPLMRAVDPVLARADGFWSQFVPPMATAPPGPVAAFEQFVEPFIPTTTQIIDFAWFIQQFRPPAPLTPPTG